MPPTLQSQFNAVSEQYDSQRRALIPCFDLFYQTAAGLPPTLYFQHYNFVVFAADKPQD